MSSVNRLIKSFLLSVSTKLISLLYNAGLSLLTILLVSRDSRQWLFKNKVI